MGKGGPVTIVFSLLVVVFDYTLILGTVIVGVGGVIVGQAFGFIL